MWTIIEPDETTQLDKGDVIAFLNVNPACIFNTDPSYFHKWGGVAVPNKDAVGDMSYLKILEGIIKIHQYDATLWRNIDLETVKKGKFANHAYRLVADLDDEIMLETGDLCMRAGIIPTTDGAMILSDTYNDIVGTKGGKLSGFLVGSVTGTGMNLERVRDAVMGQFDPAGVPCLFQVWRHIDRPAFATKIDFDPTGTLFKAFGNKNNDYYIPVPPKAKPPEAEVLYLMASAQSDATMRLNDIVAIVGANGKDFSLFDTGSQCVCGNRKGFIVTNESHGKLLSDIRSACGRQDISLWRLKSNLKPGDVPVNDVEFYKQHVTSMLRNSPGNKNYSKVLPIP